MSELDIVNLTNIDTEDFEGMWGGETKVIRAGETLPFPSFLAHHYAKHLAIKIIRRVEGNWSNESPLLQETIEKILGQVFIPSATAPIEPEKPTEPEFVESPKEEPKAEETKIEGVKCDKCDKFVKNEFALRMHKGRFHKVKK